MYAVDLVSLVLSTYFSLIFIRYIFIYSFAFNFSHFSDSVMSDSSQPHGLQHARLPCPSPTPRACTSSCPSSWWCHPAISSSILPVSSFLQSLPTLGSFPMTQFSASGDQNIGASASASVFPRNIQVWFPLG